MRWLEGWLGVVAGVVGLMVSFISSIALPHTLNWLDLYTHYAAPGGGYVISQRWIMLLTGLPTITATLLFAGVLWGLWLDLSGQRARGRVLLLGCASVIALLAIFSGPDGPSMALMSSLPPAALALVAGVIACLRRERQVDGAH
jgi:hypothetical protein